MLLGRAILRESPRLTRLRTTVKQPMPPRLTRSTAAKRASRRGLAALDPRLSQVCPLLIDGAREADARRPALEGDVPASLRRQNTAADSVALLPWAKSRSRVRRDGPSETVRADTASLDTLEPAPRPTGAGRKRTAHRIQRDATLKERLDRRVSLPHAHRSASLHQSLDHGALNHPIAEALPLGPDRPRVALAPARRAVASPPQRGLQGLRRV
jgi:hypothetical protein